MKFLATLACALCFATALAGDAALFTVGPYMFSKPADWKDVPPTSPMRKAQLKVPNKEGARDADVTFFFFGEQNGGGVEPNVQRWFGQFAGKAEAQKVEEENIKGMKVTIVTTEGTMKASPMAGITDELPHAALLGAIIEHPEGAVFVKMTGPAPLVKSSREQFMALVKSATAKK